ncbi:ribose ABC transporter permease [Clostridium thailandense]|uniref:Ribose ABC transporter permease n=1 Tax=Clostridium thailandense TaxID=2794346 RepID=A0A949WV52_9CLOT|nr:ribose ABC transporter permease [Clostridium thailandense]MBV7273292.1 ribose ABC transporter permease [Clostridium thailandense]MCH5137317.1 ribose ABC transporter permease [Clostridiaceae bacterium UIB06]
MEKDIKRLLFKYKSLIGLILLCVVISFVTPRFLTVANILNVFTQVSVNAIIAVGMCFVILTGGIDLSVGSILAITGAVAATLVKSNTNVLVTIIVVLIIGGLIGLFNGFLVSKGKIQAFIVTLASMTIFRGVTYVYTNGTPISGLGSNFTFIGNGKLMGMPVPVILIVIVVLVAWYVLTQTRYGRYVYAVGGNEDSARLSGINTDKIKTLVYVIVGATSALSGIVVTSRIGSASPNAGSGFELDAIAAVVLGGTSLAGGEGSVIGTIIGAMIIGVLNNGLNLMNVSPFYQLIVKGFVILLAVILDKKNK